MANEGISKGTEVSLMVRSRVIEGDQVWLRVDQKQNKTGTSIKVSQMHYNAHLNLKFFTWFRTTLIIFNHINMKIFSPPY